MVGIQQHNTFTCWTWKVGIFMGIQSTREKLGENILLYLPNYVFPDPDCPYQSLSCGLEKLRSVCLLTICHEASKGQTRKQQKKTVGREGGETSQMCGDRI